MSHTSLKKENIGEGWTAQEGFKDRNKLGWQEGEVGMIRSSEKLDVIPCSLREGGMKPWEDIEQVFVMG